MNNTNTGGPAFPSHGSMGEVVQEGMTLRDYFAAKAMQAEMAQGIHESDFDWMVARCYKAADAMLAARSAT
jgi:hypothetical protein